MSQEYIFEICNVISFVKNIRVYLKESGNKAPEGKILNKIPFEIGHYKNHFNK